MEPDASELPDIVEPPPDQRADVKGTIVFSRAGDIWAATGRELDRLTDADATKSDSSPPPGRRMGSASTSSAPRGGRRPTRGPVASTPCTSRTCGACRQMAPSARRSTTRSSRTPPAPGSATSCSPTSARMETRWPSSSDGPDGSGPVELHLINIRSGRMEKVAAPADGDLGHNDPAFSPDGQKIAFTYNNAQGTDGVPRIGIHTCQTRKNCSAGPTRLLRPGYAHPSWSPDAEWLAVEATRGTGRDIAIIDPRRGDVRACSSPTTATASPRSCRRTGARSHTCIATASPSTCAS